MAFYLADPITDAHGASAARGGCASLLHQPVVTTVIIGAKRMEQLEDNLGAVAVRLSDDDLATLEKASALKPEYPGWMVSFQGSTRRPPDFVAKG
jgi:aryl-alcohol dehydrogenase-like predicted oxidoreductase